MEQVRPTEPNRADPSTARPETPAAAKLKPKEHGAYAILGIPICTALIMTGPTVVGSAVAVASIAGFLAHEPLLVAIGHRGKRAQRTTPNARKRMVVLLALAFACGLIAIAAGSIAARYS
ncbi:MAG: YwiC-like family protein, partial [Planctomycetales bacterium]|nr:YwiC-like family protein [Planctomycetales bacterium]